MGVGGVGTYWPNWGSNLQSFDLESSTYSFELDDCSAPNIFPFAHPHNLDIFYRLAVPRALKLWKPSSLKHITTPSSLWPLTFTTKTGTSCWHLSAFRRVWTTSTNPIYSYGNSMLHYQVKVCQHLKLPDQSFISDTQRRDARQPTRAGRRGHSKHFNVSNAVQ